MRILRTHLSKERVAPAYLFAGPEGVGKRLAAFELAKALNCEQSDGLPAEASAQAGPCDRCASCSRILRRMHPDVHLVSPQGAIETIRIDEIRHILGRIALRPFMARAQVVILDGADRLTEEAANSLLKSLEEPPASARFILLTSQPSDCLPTIVSRCQTIRFQRLSTEMIQRLLVSQQLCAAEAAPSISRLAQGSLSRARRLAEEWPAYQQMTAHLGAEQAARWLEWAIPNDRQEQAQWLAGSIAWLRDVAVASASDDTLLAHADASSSIRRQAGELGRDRCVDAALQLIEVWGSLEQLVSPRLVGSLLREQWLELTQPAR
ncbi:MAG: DNA polymerase III subunit delta' [Candidatus Omnitrophica bacterium]|nr:DNA polymerase III subunit delta' [Candidatus Omnitrophota bacterium]